MCESVCEKTVLLLCCNSNTVAPCSVASPSSICPHKRVHVPLAHCLHTRALFFYSLTHSLPLALSFYPLTHSYYTPTHSTTRTLLLPNHTFSTRVRSTSTLLHTRYPRSLSSYPLLHSLPTRAFLLSTRTPSTHTHSTHSRSLSTHSGAHTMHSLPFYPIALFSIH